MIRKSGQPMQDSFRTRIAERWKNTPEALTIRSRAWWRQKKIWTDLGSRHFSALMCAQPGEGKNIWSLVALWNTRSLMRIWSWLGQWSNKVERLRIARKQRWFILITTLHFNNFTGILIWQCLRLCIRRCLEAFVRSPKESNWWKKVFLIV